MARHKKRGVSHTVLAEGRDRPTTPIGEKGLSFRVAALAQDSYPLRPGALRSVQAAGGDGGI
ncbi:MAG: hypothetical protein DMG43_11405 [Acidobacteria bacterium]|nr:MAG: hypothetical protein DMG43_11405 [Acidobacteriota bacterium]